MSSHNALESERNGSTNERLDSILDALSSLGDSARPATKPQSAESVQHLHAVPDLVDAADPMPEHSPDTEPVAPADPAIDTVPVVAAPLVPPAIPTFEDPVLDVEPAPTTMAFEPASVVDASDPIEAVTPLVESETLAVPVVPQTTEAAPIPMPEHVVDPEPVFSTDHVFDTTPLTAPSPIDPTEFESPLAYPPVPESPTAAAPSGEATVYELAPMDSPEPEPEPVSVQPEAVSFEPEPVQPEAVSFEPEPVQPEVVSVQPEVVSVQPEVVSVQPEAVSFEPGPEPVPFQSEAVSFEPEPVQPEVVSVQPEVVSVQPEAVSFQPEPEPTMPASIFGTSPAPQVDEQVPAIGFATPQASTDTHVNPDDAWVSHHVTEEVSAVAPEAPIDLFNAVATPPGEGQELSGDALWHVEVIEPTPELVDSFEEAPVTQATPIEELADPWADVATHTPETEAEVVELFSLNPPQTAAPDVDESGFVTDDELPIPDFTGVYDETPTGNVWDLDAIAGGTIPLAEGEASRTAATARQTELDMLRPVEPWQQTPVEETVVPDVEILAEEKQSSDGSGKVVMVVLCGLVALAFIFVDDPGFLAGIEDLINQFRG